MLRRGLSAAQYLVNLNVSNITENNFSQGMNDIFVIIYSTSTKRLMDKGMAADVEYVFVGVAAAELQNVVFSSSIQFFW